MKTQATNIERRQRERTGVLAEIENITYRALRKYGIDGAAAQQTPAGTAQESA